jgi:hypothetical protein
MDVQEKQETGEIEPNAAKTINSSPFYIFIGGIYQLVDRQ